MPTYGSIHTHFESQYDTGNNQRKMVENFIASGAKKVAVTEHGVFSSYEDLKDIVSELRTEAEKHEEEFPDFDIIPGVEGYFGEEAAHLILVAKDYEGYVSLCKIISESNENIVKGKPIITLDNLQRNVNKGHLICTTACIAGPFGRLFGLDKMNLEEKTEKLDKELAESGYREFVPVIETYKTTKELYKKTVPTKTEIKTAESKAKKGDESLLEIINDRIDRATELGLWLAEHNEEFERAEIAIGEMGAAKYARKLANYEDYQSKLREIEEKNLSGETDAEAYALLQDYVDIFGESDFYFEIQNHELDKEAVIYNKVISFAYQAGHPHFIASNDIHIGVTKSDPEYENMLKRRNVIKYTRFNKYTEETEDDKEYTIKSDEELKEELLKIIRPVETATGYVTAEEIVDQAIGNIERALEECEIEFPKNENHYPKFCDDENAEFERLVWEGVKTKFPNGFPQGREKEYEDRLKYEIGVIKQMGYAGYHLIVADYLAYGRLLGYLPTQEEIDNAPLTIKELDAYITERGYPRIGNGIGPGRGSGAGSLACYALGITDVDPIPYDLLFERFLNTERVSMPDIDSDFKTDIRAKVVDYCRARYGAECICQIMTKSYGATKGNLRLAARYLGAQECENDPKYKELEQELSDIAVAMNMSDIKKKKEKIADNVSELNKNLKKETDEDKISELLTQIDTANEKLKDFENEINETKSELKERKEAIQKEMEEFLKNWYNRADRLAKMFDELGGVLPDVSELTTEEQNIVSLAEILDGVFTGYGQHAAGTIISGDRLSNIIPLMWNDKKGSMETQCTMAQAEAKGLLKMDFLGLNNLDIITDIVQNPTRTTKLEKFFENKSPAVGDSIDKLLDGTLQDYEKRDEMLKDPAIYKDIFCTGLTQGVFQFESEGMKKMLVNFQPESFEDIVLLVATYRPGPMDYIPEIIASKWYEKTGGDYEEYSKIIKKIYPFSQKEYDEKQRKGLAYFYDKDGKVLDYVPHSITLQNEALQKILEPTYGCPVYQEQIMQIFQQMAGYSLGGADIVRRYMSKKKVDKLAKEKEVFVFGDEKRGIPGCMKLHGITQQQAEDLFEQMMPFAKYGFNKSHATAYAMVSMFTAYLKKYHTSDFFRSSLCAIKALSEIPDFVKEFPAFNLELKAPSMFANNNKFSVEDDGRSIRYGLKYIKGFSEQNVNPCSSMQEFIQTNPGISLKIVEKYAQLGMFTECWQKDKKTGRVKGNRHECLRWLKTNGALFVKYLEHVEKTDALEMEKTKLEQQKMKASTSEEEKALQKEINKVSNSLSTWKEKRKESADALNANYAADADRGFVPKESPAEILENRQWEIEMLSLPFDIEESLDKISYCKNTSTFDDLKNPGDKADRKKIRVPAVVLSVSAPKKTKKGNNTYFDVMLMDKNRNIINRRFEERPDVLDGEFSLMIDDCKYYLCDMNGYKPTVSNEFHKQAYVSCNASSQEKINAIKLGGNIEYVRTAGRRVTPVIVTNTATQDIERDIEERE